MQGSLDLAYVVVETRVLWSSINCAVYPAISLPTVQVLSATRNH